MAFNKIKQPSHFQNVSVRSGSRRIGNFNPPDLIGTFGTHIDIPGIEISDQRRNRPKWDVLKLTQPIVMILMLLQVTVIPSIGESQPGDTPEYEKAEAVSRKFSQGDESPDEESSEDQDWGCEIKLDEMISMAQKGQLIEIQWHVLPNVLRAQASDGRIFHLKNEDAGVDLRNTLINAGVKIGKGGVLFHHVF